MARMSADKIKLPCDSPFSPKGVMEILSFEGQLSPINAPAELCNNERTLAADQMQHQSNPRLQIGSSNSTTNDGNNFWGSSASHTYLKIKPSDTTMIPILRAVLDVRGDAGGRLLEAIVEDVLMTRLHFVKVEKNIFCGQILGHRIAAIQFSNTHLDNWLVACADKETASQFITLLRSCDMEVKTI